MPFANTELCLEHAIESHCDLIEGLYPSFISSQNLHSGNWDMRTSRNSCETMRAERLATIILPFEHLDQFCQIGTDLKETSPLYIVCIGRKKG